MIEDEKIVELFFERSEQAIQELGNKYGKVCRKLSYNIVNNMQDAEECVNDAYLGAWNAIPPEKPDPLLTYLCKIVRNDKLRTALLHRNASSPNLHRKRQGKGHSQIYLTYKNPGSVMRERLWDILSRKSPKRTVTRLFRTSFVRLTKSARHG